MLSNVSKTTALLLSASMLSSCASSPPPVQTTEAACKILKPIDYHLCADGLPENALNQCDTAETAMRVYYHNRDLAALCPPR